MSILHLPITFANIAEWVRRAGGAINQLITDKLDLSGGTLTGDLVVPDEAYGAGWDGSLEVPTKNALYDKIETLGSGGGTTDELLTFNNGGAGAASGATFDGSAPVTVSYNTVGAAASSHTHAQADVTGLTTADSPQFAGINLGHASDTTLTRVSAGVAAIEGVNVVTTAGGVTFAADISVPDEAYDATNWNGSVEVPTKNAIRDKIEAMGTPSLVKISTQVLGAAAATIDFSSIANSYEDLVLVVQGRGTNASAVVSTLLRMNGDSGANYNSSRWNRIGSNALVAQTSGDIGEIAGASAPASRAHQLIIEVVNYKRTTFHKTATASNGVSSSDVAGGQSPQHGQVVWKSTAAITQLTLLLSAGNFDTGTVATLYGRG